MDRKLKSVLKYCLSLALAAFLVWFAFRSVDWSAFTEGLKQTRWGYIALFIAASIGALVFRMFRWKALLKPVDDSVKDITVWDANNVGNLTNVVLPGSGEFVRCGYVATGKARFENVFGTAVMERIWDIMAIAVLFVLALSLNGERFGSFFAENIWNPMLQKAGSSIWLIIASACIALAAAAWAIWHFRDRSRICRKTVDAFAGLFKGFGSFKDMKRKWLFGLYTILIWLMYVLMSWFVLKAIPELDGLGFVDALFVSAVGNIASVIPVPGGIGAYHYLVALTLSSIYASTWATGILFATLSHELHAVLIIILGLASYIRFSLRKK